MPGAALMPDKPLNARQELFCQAVARGMTLTAAYAEAGYKRHRNAWQMTAKPHVRARIQTLLAQAAAVSVVSAAQLTQRLLGNVDRCEAGTSAAMLRAGQQGLMAVARLNGLDKPERAKPPREPITEIRRIIVQPDGREWEY